MKASSSTQSLPLISSFFDYWSLPSALAELNTLFTKAAGNTAWRPANPYIAIENCRQLRHLNKAAFFLYNGTCKDAGTMVRIKEMEDDTGYIETAHFMRSGAGARAFDHFPRWLTAEEYADPAKAIHRYCRCRSKKEWKQFYKNLALCSLSSGSLTDYENAGRLFKLRALIFKLVEACHLIHIRSGKISAPPG